jgi:hypothetical protein
LSLNPPTYTSMLTETPTVSTTIRPGATRFGSVGQTRSGVEVTFATDGESLRRSATLMSGYRNNPQRAATFPVTWRTIGTPSRNPAKLQ